MYIPALLHEFKSVSPEVKFFIVKVVQKYGLDSEIGESVESLVANIGVTDRVIVSAVSYLLECGHLKRLPSLPISKGRPQNRYQLQRSLSFLSGKGSATVLAEQNLPLIDDLFVDVGTDKENRRHKLRVSNRLLLAVLLSHADKFGVVRCLGSADLKRLTGMTAGGLESQLVKLKNAGYIRCSISGVTGKYLLGISKSVYYLNLKHPSFAEVARRGVTLLYAIGSKISYEHLRNEANEIYFIAGDIRKKEYTLNRVNKRFSRPEQTLSRREVYNYLMTNEGLLPEYSNFADILSCFGDSGRSGVISYLQFKLCEYASVLLSSDWGLVFSKSSIADPELLQKIERELLCAFSSSKKQGISNLYTKEVKDFFIDFIYQTSLLLAKKALRIIGKLEERFFFIPDVDFLILPSPNSSWTRCSFAIECFSRADLDKSSRFLYIDDKAANELKVFEFTREDEFPLEERYVSGLLTDPNSKTGDPRKKAAGFE